MARQLLTLNPEPLYRGVVLLKYSGLHGLPMRTYTDSSTGQTYEYHSVSVFGPYEKPGTAKSQVNSVKRYAEQGHRQHVTYDAATRNYTYYPVAEVQGFVEAGVPAWGLHVG